jgi:hypothetical protein
MKKVTILVFALLLAVAGSAIAQDEQILHLSGEAWEDGAFPPSVSGDEFQAVGILNDIEQPLVWDTNTYAYTWYFRELISLGETTIGPMHLVSYSGGLFTIYVDWLPSDHDYGINPPNATSPSTFTNGISTYLDGYFTSFSMTFNASTASGTFTGQINFTGGDVYPLLNATDGWTFGSNIAGFSPEGYDLELNGSVFLTVVSVEDETWGGIKSLYR